MDQQYQCIEFPFFNLPWAGVVFPPPDNRVYCPTSILSGVLGVGTKVLHDNHYNNRDRFHPLRYDEIVSKEFIEFIDTRRAAFGIRRLRADMLWWPENDMYTHAMICNSEQSWQFRQALASHLIEYRINQVPPNYVPLERLLDLQSQYEVVSGERDDLREEMAGLKTRVNRLETIVDFIKPAAERTASNLGKALYDQRFTKIIREN